MKFFDFFAGIGGFRLGMEMAGHECVGHCEIDKYANMSYNAMHNPKESEVFFSDVRTIRAEDMPTADCYCFGFPCQSFSIAGKRGGFDDTRGTLFFEIMRLAKERHPKYLLAENVRGLLSHDGGRTFETIIRTMDELGYLVEWQVLNSKYYVPQNRERVYIIGHFGGKPGSQILPIRNTGQEDCADVKQVGKLKAKRENPNAFRVYAAEGIAPTISTCQGGGRVPHVVAGIGEKKSNGGSQWYQQDRIYTIDGVSPALNATPGHNLVPKILDNTYKNRNIRQYSHAAPTIRSERHGLLVDDGAVIRRLTPRECFRLQGFPDEYFERAAAVCSDSQLYKQAGNAVTVNVVYEIAKRLEGGNQ